jgi:uncharacterized membrane protein
MISWIVLGLIATVLCTGAFRFGATGGEFSGFLEGVLWGFFFIMLACAVAATVLMVALFIDSLFLLL